MSRTATELHSGSWRQHFMLETDDGQYVPLIPSDPRADPTKAQVFKLDAIWKARGHALRVERNEPILPAFSSHPCTSTESPRPYAQREILVQPGLASACGNPQAGLPRREPFALDMAAIMRDRYPEQATSYPRTPTSADSKEYCTYWIRKGECDYMQQGCRYKHEMPDVQTLRSIGFRTVPEWYTVRTMPRLRTHPDVLQSILNRNANDSVSETDSDDSEATLAESTLCQSKAPTTTAIQTVAVPAPSTFDLLTFDDEEEEEAEGHAQFPKAPNNTPETSSYVLPTLSSPNRSGRFIPAGEQLPRMTTPSLQPGPRSPTVRSREEPVKPRKEVYTAAPRPAPIFNEYFKEQKAAKSQEKLSTAAQEEVKQRFTPPSSSPPSSSISAPASPPKNADNGKNREIAELQAKLVALTRAARSSTAPIATTARVAVAGPRNPPSTLSSGKRVLDACPAKNEPMLKHESTPKTHATLRTGLMASKHSIPLQEQPREKSPRRARGERNVSEARFVEGGRARRMTRARKTAGASASASARVGVEKDKVPGGRRHV